MTNSDNLWRTQPMYSFAEAAHLSNVSTSTVRNWLVGYTGRNREIRPLFSSHTDQGPRISFLQLIEIVVAAKFRKAERVSYQTVYAAYVHAKDMYNLEYPFANLTLVKGGGKVDHVGVSTA